jgi:phosphohistidine phosphatase
MRLYLVRHGEAKSKEEDPDRHLTARGLADARKAARFIRKLGLHVDAVWHSGKTRALETAEEMAGAVQSGAGLMERKGLAPDDDARSAARAAEGAAGDLMIVGHLPLLAKLASLLVTGKESRELVRFPAAGVLCLDHDAQEGWRVAWMIVPEIL